MRRADKRDRGSVVIRVRQYAGTFIATGGGKRASCSASEYSAAWALAGKLLAGRAFDLTQRGSGANRHYRATVSTTTPDQDNTHE